VRINMVSEHASPLAMLGGVDAGGQNVHVGELAAALGRLGVEVIVHTRRDDPSLGRRVPFAPNVTVDHVTAGPAEPIPKDDLLPHMGAFARDLERVWTDERPDIVHSHFWMSGLASMAATAPLGIPLAHTYHALGVVKQRNQGAADTSPAARCSIEADLARHADRIIATSAEEMAELVKMGGHTDRMRLVPCGVDLGRFNASVAPEPSSSGRFRVVVVSRLVERKGIGNVIQALACLDDAELVVAGGPPSSLLDDDDEARRLLRLADRLGVADRVELRGAIGRDQVPALLRSADVVACCPWYEPFGLVAVEAMACGVPVVASAVGGLAETVVHGSTGLHVPPRAPHRIANALQTLMDNGPLRRRMAGNATRRALRYGWDRIAQETLSVAEELVRRAVIR